MNGAAIATVEYVRDRERAELLLHPLRLRVLEEAGAPSSASEIARRMDESRQKVNYHVRELAGAGFLALAGERRKRNLIERRYLASARSYVLAPEVLGPLAVGGPTVGDRLSAGRLLALTSWVQSELGRVMEEADAAGKRVSTLSLDTEFGFESAEQRTAFTRALEEAVTAVVARFTSPVSAEGEVGGGRPYRLVLGCYPVPGGSDAGSGPGPGPAATNEAEH